MALDYRIEYQRYKHYFVYLKPFIENPVTRAYFSVVASLFTIAVFIAFAIRPTFATIITLNREISDKTSLSVQLDAKINALTALQSEYQSVEDSLPLVDLALPDNPEISSTISHIEKVATVSGVKIGGIAGGKIDYQQTASSSAIIVPLTVDLTGDYPGFQLFLSQLATLPRLIIISDLNLTSKTAKLTANIYYFPR